MFRSLRRRLVWSQILPVLLVIPIMGVTLVYALEKQFIIPQLAENLLGDSRMLAEISSAEFELWGDPILFEELISRVKLDPSIQVMFLDPSGRILFSSDTGTNLRGVQVSSPGLDNALNGKETALTNYSILRTNNVMIDVFEPVSDASGAVVGIVRLTYRLASLYELFGQLRWEIAVILMIGLVSSVIIGAWLAITISRPVQQVTTAIYGIATGQRREQLDEIGPDELRSQARAVNYLVDQLHSLEQSRRQLLANLVHELGRPLGALRSAIHALANGAADDPRLLKDLTVGMDAETRRLQNLLEELSNLYDKSLGDLELNIQPVAPNEWLPAVLSPWEAAAEEKKLRWEEKIQENIPPIQMDADRAAQIIGNLLSNAVKYTPAGGSIQVVAAADESCFTVRVSDSGVGVQPDEKDKIFQPFYRGDPSRRIKQGMGLGLTIARDLAVAHGGSLELETKPGSGSAFVLSLPYVKKEPPQNQNGAKG
ncbi:signal transduction histidine kinase [Longilinea arvoryzae]|uniref:histidine kinase n=1 Tax=Longilinea arvoryzae TaxID=360412 RepID=A0A0S7BAG4_9CHLR|nr:sensor histidine kinase [Longilinea arvoryzae]GAP14620.1 signal transduction histidine kinase [Longilinea arvoryzae]